MQLVVFLFLHAKFLLSYFASVCKNPFVRALDNKLDFQLRSHITADQFRHKKCT